MSLTTARVTYLYDLMDSAYDAAAIREYSRELGHQPITDHPKRYRKVGERKVPLRKNSRSWKRVIEKELRAEEMTWAEQDRFAERTMVERVFSRLKDEFGFRSVRVRGASKVMAHLLFRSACADGRSTPEADRLTLRHLSLTPLRARHIGSPSSRRVCPLPASL